MVLVEGWLDSGIRCNNFVYNSIITNVRPSVRYV